MNPQSPRLNLAKQHRTPLFLAALVLAGLVFITNWANAQITVLDKQQASIVNQSAAYTMWTGYNASAASKLVIGVSTRNKNNNYPGSISSVTYNGITMMQAVQYSVSAAPGSRGKVGIFYLDNPGAAGDIVVNWAGATGSGCVASLLALNGTATGVSVASSAGILAADNTGSASVTLTTTSNNSLVFAQHLIQAASPLPTAPSPLTPISSKVGSGWSGAGGYRLVSTAGSVSPTFTTASAQDGATVAAAFAPGAVTPTVTVTVGTYTYSGSPQGPNSYTTNPPGDAGAPTWSYVGTGATSYGPSPTPPTLAGTYTATVSLAAVGGSFNAASSSATAFTISPVTPGVTVTVGSYLYNGSPLAACRAFEILGGSPIYRRLQFGRYHRLWV